MVARGTRYDSRSRWPPRVSRYTPRREGLLERIKKELVTTDSVKVGHQTISPSGLCFSRLVFPVDPNVCDRTSEVRKRDLYRKLKGALAEAAEQAEMLCERVRIRPTHLKGVLWGGGFQLPLPNPFEFGCPVLRETGPELMAPKGAARYAETAAMLRTGTPRWQVLGGFISIAAQRPLAPSAFVFAGREVR